MQVCSQITILNLVFFGLAIVLSVGLTYGFYRLCLAYHILDYPGGHKTHTHPTPLLGGAALFLSFWISILAAYMVCGDGVFDSFNFLQAFLLSSLVIYVTGLLDDLMNLKSYYKLFGQAVAAVILIAHGYFITRMHIPFTGQFELGIWGFPVTVIWVVVITNSINFVDGLDGLAGVIGLTVCIGLLIVGAFLNLAVVSVIAAIIGGALFGFLFYNLPPARIFMGNNGALFVGFVFSVVAVFCPIKSYTAVAMFVPLIAAALPIIETIVTPIRRIITGRKFYQSDTNQSFHYLRRFRFSTGTTILIFGSVSLLFNAFIPAFFWFDRKQVFSIFVLFLMILVAIFFILRLVKGNGER